MSEQLDYRRAYQRQKLAREKAEELLETRSRELYDANETLKAAYSTLKDQKDQILQQEKLASIGLLAAGIAHEINNPVGFVKSNLQTLQDYTKTYVESLAGYKNLASAVMKADHEKYQVELSELEAILERSDLDYVTQDGIESILESLAGIQRIEEIIVNLSDFARTDSDASRTLCDINSLIDNTIKLVWNEIKYKCELEKEFGDLPQIYARPGQIRQVFINILVNAAHAMETSGTIRIVTELDGEYIAISFIDSGAGIPEGALEKLFDPFFTTKEVGSGTGLGLYVSHGIITAHGGMLEAMNNDDQGASFNVKLPIEMRKKRKS